MGTKAEEIQRIISATVRDLLDAFRLQVRAGPVTDQAPEGIIFRAAHPVVHSLEPYPAEQWAALLPKLVSLMLAALLEDVAGADGSPHARGPRCRGWRRRSGCL